MGFQVRELRSLEVERAMSLSQVRASFETDQRLIGLSYINGLVESVHTSVEETIIHPEKLLLHVPTILQDRYLDVAHSFAGDQPYTALHWRRGYHLKEVAKILGDLELPTAEAMMELVPKRVREVIVATDSGLDEFSAIRGTRNIRSFRHDDPQVNAVVDLALCIGANQFIGTRASTFSAYVDYSRRARHYSRESTILL
jgi:hypothetical protein